MTLPPGSKLGTYDVIDLLGAGGMGEVYRARDRRLERDVAIKVLPASQVADEDRRRRFLQEARAASALNHPNIVTIHEIESADDVDFIVMEYVDGQNLAASIPSGGMPVREVLRLAFPMADALGRAHDRGIVHRDLKPANVVVSSDGIAKILDFGLAKLVARSESSPESDTVTVDLPPATLSRVGTITGTIGYMAPEQASGKQVDHRCDIFSFGALLYEMATGQRAFGGGSTAEVLAAVLKDDPRPPRQLAPVPPELERLILRCLEKDPGQRPQRFQDIRAELQQIEQNLDAPAAPARAGSGSRARWWMGAAVVAVIAAVAIGWRSWPASSAPPSTARIDSLAVLPFINASADPQIEYLADGLTVDLINNLARLRRFHVVPSSSVFGYKGKTAEPHDTGRRLGVRAVVTGRVSRRGDDVTVAAELVDVDGRSLIWGQQYTRKGGDLPSMQGEMANEIVSRLRIELTGDERQRLARGGTQSAEAYDLYLKGIHHWSQPMLAGLKEAITYFERSAQADPNYAPPHVGLSDVYGSIGYLALGPIDQVWPKAKSEALKALELDPGLGSARAALGHAILFHDWDFPRAKQELDRALALDPDRADTHHWYAHYWMTQSDWTQGIEMSRKAVELEPINLFLRGHLIYFLAANRRPDEIIEEVRRAAELDPNFWVIHTGTGLAQLLKGRPQDAIAALEQAADRSGRMGLTLADLGYAYALAGETDKAQKVIAELQTLATQHGFSVPVPVAVIQAGLGQTDAAFATLERAYSQRDPMLLFLKSWYWFDKLRVDPRYDDLVGRIGFK